MNEPPILQDLKLSKQCTIKSKIDKTAKSRSHIRKKTNKINIQTKQQYTNEFRMELNLRTSQI